ncbi:type II toxin-antitoxin system RelE/ParE family toxin [Amphritea pacifica]|uniref:Type II toxin-antitoxin system RelE/ParE family toxin n=1 Tax=Amphritea pacifica TaxID=2811233 RepID=A0ABS2W408_9GAMM|nr:type II toxin-antitoxin system RelE/ParE family toxin [Amphritea pacifica]MBN0986447.1 type II toxin-antitoxin system RelE/ParE family toxin [Amphritea pacifica]
MIYSFTDKAEKDLEGILSFTLEHWGKRKVVEYLDGIESAALNLCNHPDMGIDRSDLIVGVRSIPYESHVIYYTQRNAHLIIIRIIHCSMDPNLHIKG